MNLLIEKEPVMTLPDLPALPESKWFEFRGALYETEYGAGSAQARVADPPPIYRLYTADQMRAYALEAAASEQRKFDEARRGLLDVNQRLKEEWDAMGAELAKAREALATLTPDTSEAVAWIGECQMQSGAWCTRVYTQRDTFDMAYSRNLRPLFAHPAPAAPTLDPVLAKFYDVDSVTALLTAMEEHIDKLQDAARRNVKPWEDTFPPTLLPKYLRDNGLPEPTPPTVVVVQAATQPPAESAGGEVERQLALYRKAINRIDDSFEYSYGDDKARKRVREILAELAAALAARGGK